MMKLMRSFGLGTCRVHGCLHLFMVQVDYKLFGKGWCMVDALVMVQVGAWLMH